MLNDEFNPDLDTANGEEQLNIDTVLDLAPDGASVSIYFMDIPVLDVDGFFEVMGSIEARDDLLQKLAQVLADQTKREIQQGSAFIFGAVSGCDEWI